MKITIEVNEATFNEYIKEAVNKKLEEMGLLRYINEEILRLFRSFKSNHSTIDERLHRVESLINKTRFKEKLHKPVKK